MAEASGPDHAPTPGGRRAAAALGFGLAAAVVALDQASKAWILYGIDLPARGRIELSPIFDLTMVWNRGVSFGLFGGESDWGRWILSGFAVLVSVILSIWLTRSDRLLPGLALGAIIGGAIGNLIDRVRFGAVVDFFDFSGLYFPFVFNVADAAITIGVGLLLLDLVLEERAAKRAADAETNSGKA